MRTIFKYQFCIDDTIRVVMPMQSKVLSIQVQRGEPTMWALVETDLPKVTREFRVRGTGHEIGDDCGPFIGTFQLHDGALVFHLFEAA